MKPVTITLTVENREQADSILAVLSEAEEQGALDFAFETLVADGPPSPPPADRFRLVLRQGDR